MIRAIRLRAVKEAPYLARALWALEPVERPGFTVPGMMIPTMAADRWGRVYYCPEAIRQWGAEIAAWVLIHEVEHLLLGHHGRFDAVGGSTPMERAVWNQAADASIHEGWPELLKELEAGADKTGIVPATVERLGLEGGRVTEEYYRDLLKNLENLEESSAGEPAQGPGTAGSATESTDPREIGEQPSTRQDGGCGVSRAPEESPATQEGTSGDAGEDSRQQGGEPSAVGAGDEDAGGAGSSPSSEGGDSDGCGDGVGATPTSSSPSGQGASDSSQPPDFPSGSGGESGLHGTSEEASSSSATRWHDCGSCCGGPPRDYEEPAPESAGGTSEFPGTSEATWEVIRRQVARDVIEHASRNRGNVPGHLQRWAERLLQPKIDWRRELAYLLRGELARGGAADYSWSRPSRRISPEMLGGALLPSMRSPCPEVAVVVDTSGSIPDSDIRQFLSEVMGILRSTGQHDLEVLAVDADVRWRGRIRHPREAVLPGGGGTDMGAGIHAALKPPGSRRWSRPKAVVVLTDGITPWPDKSPDVPVIVATTYKPGPSWARTVEINPKGDE